jgi:hypothetical protein
LDFQYMILRLLFLRCMVLSWILGFLGIVLYASFDLVKYIIKLALWSSLIFLIYLWPFTSKIQPLYLVFCNCALMYVAWFHMFLVVLCHSPLLGNFHFTNSRRSYLLEAYAHQNMMCWRRNDYEFPHPMHCLFTFLHRYAPWAWNILAFLATLIFSTT